MDIFLALQEGGTQPPVGWVESVVGALATAVVVLFLMVLKAKDTAREDLQKANEALMAAKQKQLEDAVEHERAMSTLRERIGRRGGTDA